MIKCPRHDDDVRLDPWCCRMRERALDLICIHEGANAWMIFWPRISSGDFSWIFFHAAFSRSGFRIFALKCRRSVHRSTEVQIKACMSCQAGPKQGQAEQLSKIRKKFLATTYKLFFRALYNIHIGTIRISAVSVLSFLSLCHYL